MLRMSLVMLALVPAALAAQAGATTSVKVQLKADGEVSKKPGAEATAQAQTALVSAGRATPTSDEVSRAAIAIEKGFTMAQIEAIAKAAPADRSLVVSFNVVAKLTEHGVTAADAASKVQAKLQAKDPDTAIEALVEAKPQGAKKP